MRDILKQQNHSDVLFKQIDKLAKSRAKHAARKVATVVDTAQERLEIAKREAKYAQRNLDKMKKALKKYKKTGDESHLEIFGV